jgi:hypothetical protein
VLALITLATASAEILPGRNRSSQPGVQAGRKALRIRHANGMEVRKKRPRGSSEPPEPPSLSPWHLAVRVFRMVDVVGHDTEADLKFTGLAQNLAGQL